MKKLFAITMVTALLLSSAPAMSSAYVRSASAYAPTPPAPPIPPTTTPPPAGPGVVDESTPTPPTSGDLPPEMEQNRARQAIEAVLEKYLDYWGPRYQVTPVEVAVEGEWAHGVAEWRGIDSTLGGPIHILARRLPSGTWQALMPSEEGLYLQWVDQVPESLVPAGQEIQLRSQAAEADALWTPRTTPAFPPAVATIPLDGGAQGELAEPVFGPAEPTETPIPIPWCGSASLGDGDERPHLSPDDEMAARLAAAGHCTLDHEKAVSD